MRKYGEIISSGLGWLGDIPAHWQLKRLKNFALVNPHKNIADDASETVTFLPMEKVSEKGEIDCSLKRPVKDLLTGFTYFEKHDIILAKITPCFENGKGAYLDKLDTPFGFGSTEFHVIRAHENLDSTFLYYVTTSNLFRDLGEASMTGSGGQKRVPTSFVENFPLAVPPLAEQLTIAAYLEHKTGQLDKLLAEKQALLGLLQQKREAIINEAVTQGLDTKAPRKHSGVDWLGDVPGHWEVKQLKHLTTKIGSGVTPLGGAEVYQDEGVPLLRSQNIYSDGLRLDDVAFITEEVHASMRNSQVENGDVLLNITGASIGRCYFYEGETGRANVNQHVCIIRPNEKVTKEFLHLALASTLGQFQVDLSQNGASREGLTFSQLKNFRIPTPSVAEQREILAVVDGQLQKIGEASQLIKTQLDTLKSYRQALISEVVTGKVDVRGETSAPATDSPVEAPATNRRVRQSLGRSVRGS